MESCRRTIVFAAVNASYSHAMLSYSCLRAFTAPLRPEWQWRYFDSTINDDEASFACRIAAAEPEVVAATVYLFNQEVLMRVLVRVKALRPEVKIYLGGPQFLGHNESFLRQFPAVDAVIRGDESSFYRLLAEDFPVEVPGRCRLDRGGVYCDEGKAEFTGPVTELPSPYRPELFISGKPFYQLETSRGCSGRCTFCSSSCSARVLHFPVERVRADLEFLAGAGVTEIRVLDRTFNHGGERPLRLLRLFREEFPGLRFHLEINPARIDAATMAEIAAFPPGRLHLEAGVQSLRPEVLAAVRRPANPEQTLAGLALLGTCPELPVHADLIAGLPEQSPDSVFDDVRQLMALGIEEIQLETLKVLPGTVLAEHPPAGACWNPLPPYEVLRTAAFDPDALQRIRVLSRIIDGYYNHSPLRPFFAAFTVDDPGFLTGFTAWVADGGEPLLKHSPQRRLERLDAFARATGRELLREVVKFVWLQLGFSAEKYGVTMRRSPEAAPSSDTLIWSSGDALPPVRCATADFAWPVADMLRTSHLPGPGACSYVFYYRHGQKSSGISRR